MPVKLKYFIQVIMENLERQREIKDSHFDDSDADEDEDGGHKSNMAPGYFKIQGATNMFPAPLSGLRIVNDVDPADPIDLNALREVEGPSDQMLAKLLLIATPASTAGGASLEVRRKLRQSTLKKAEGTKPSDTMDVDEEPQPQPQPQPAEDRMVVDDDEARATDRAGPSSSSSARATTKPLPKPRTVSKRPRSVPTSPAKGAETAAAGAPAGTRTGRSDSDLRSPPPKKHRAADSEPDSPMAATEQVMAFRLTLEGEDEDTNPQGAGPSVGVEEQAAPSASQSRDDTVMKDAQAFDMDVDDDNARGQGVGTEAVPPVGTQATYATSEHSPRPSCEYS